MTPDMKRLCRAVVAAGDAEGCTIFPDLQEAIVRAVLTELRNVSEEAVDAAYESALAENARGVVQDLIDHILTDAPSPETQSTATAG